MVRWNKNVFIEGIAFKIKRSKPKSVSVTEDRHLTVECVYNVSCVLWNVDQGDEGLCSLLKKTTVRAVGAVASGPPTVQDCFRSWGLCPTSHWGGGSKCPQQSRQQWRWRGYHNLRNLLKYVLYTSVSKVVLQTYTCKWFIQLVHSRLHLLLPYLFFTDWCCQTHQSHTHVHIKTW